MNDSDPPVNFDMEQLIEALENDENDEFNVDSKSLAKFHETFDHDM